MYTTTRNKLKKSVPVLLLGATLLVGVMMLSQAAALAAPAGAPQAATLPAETCTYDGVTNIRTCELWATSGTLTLPGSSVPIWGYTDTDPALGGTAQLPGPALIANQGESVQVILHNGLAENTALIFPGQDMIPDLVGVPSGGMATYTFVASNPGTYLYEAGLLPNAQHQVAMGLYGALIVRPALNQAYGPETAFDDEALLVLSEIAPALNNSANPAAFDLRDYKPRYWLINGKAYRDTDEILSAAGNRVLLRYVNAGLQHHSMGLLGMDQEVLAIDGSPLTYPYRVAAATIGSGQTADRIATVPASADPGTRYALYDTSMLLHNNGAAGFGGMLTFLATPPDGPVGDTAGPTTSAVALAPNPTDGSVDVTLTATVSDIATGGANIMAAEYFTDTTGLDGSGVMMQAADGAFDAPTEAVTVTVSTAALATLMSGDHTFYVHGQDTVGNWGPFNFAVLSLDKLGPTTSGSTLFPNPSDGSVEVSVSATGDDSATGNSNIVAAEFYIGAIGEMTHTMTVNVAAPIASLDGAIVSATMGTLAEGAHTVYVHSMDAFGHWGDYDTATLVVNQTGPETGNVSANPNPNNGELPYSPTVFAVRVDATLTGTVSTIQRVEGFIDTVGTDGDGFPLTPSDGLFDELVEDAYAFIPLSTINQLSEGTHPIWIHGQDASGNWGAAVAVDLVIDKTEPTVSIVLADPNPTGAATSTTLTASASDTASDIAMAEWFDGADPGRGNGTPMTVAFNGTDWDLSATIDVSTWAPGDHTISVRARDAAGNWSATDTVLLCVEKCNDVFADSFESGDFSAWTSTTGAVSVIGGAAMDGDGFGMAADITGGTASYVTDNTPGLPDTPDLPDAETSYHARFYFNPNSALSQNNAPLDIVVGQDAASTDIFRVQYRRRNAQGGSYQVRGVVLTAGGEETTGWVDINDISANAIEIAWESGTNASFSLYVHGGLQETLTGLDTSTYSLDTVHLGPSGGNGLNDSASGTVYLDAFVSTRYTVIGP